MVHIATLAVAVVAAFSGAVSAKNCEPGKHICGWTLLSDEYNATKYRPLMRANLLGDHWVPDEDHMNNTLFECVGDNGDALGFPPQYCGGPDQCLPKGTGQCPDAANACCASD